MISRVAEHCFWLGRYLERVESAARVLFVTRNLALDAELTPRQCWQPLLIVSGEAARFEALHGPDAAENPEQVQHHMTWEEQNPSCIKRSVSAARENARSIREVISLETWEAINELHLWLHSPSGRTQYDGERYNFYRRIRNACHLALGVVNSTMLHDTPSDFIWLGALLERAGQTARILDVHYHALTKLNTHRVVETALWLSILRACSGYEPFMKRHRGSVTRDGVTAFLILEEQFPRSVRFGIAQAYARLCAIRPPGHRDLPGGQALERLKVLNAWMNEKTSASLNSEGLHELLTHVVDESAAVCNDIGRELLGGQDLLASPSQAQ